MSIKNFDNMLRKHQMERHSITWKYNDDDTSVLELIALGIGRKMFDI